MNVNKLALACGVAMLGLSSIAAAEVSMNIGVTSNYIWRGVTQTGDAAAVSGGFDWSNASGLYAGTWASNVDFSADVEETVTVQATDSGGDTYTYDYVNTYKDPSLTAYELDLYGGYAGEIAGFGYDAGLIYYTYDSDADANFLELALAGSWQMLSFGLNYTLSSDVNDTPDAEVIIDGDMYYYAGASFDLPQDYSVGLTVGQYAFEDDGVNGADLDYTHYQIDISKSAGDFGDVTLSVSDTDMSNDDMKFFASWSKSF